MFAVVPKVTAKQLRMSVLVHYLWLYYLRGKFKVWLLLLECVNTGRSLSVKINEVEPRLVGLV